MSLYSNDVLIFVVSLSTTHRRRCRYGSYRLGKGLRVIVRNVCTWLVWMLGMCSSSPSLFVTHDCLTSIWMQHVLHKLSTGHAQSGENPELRTLFFRLAWLAERPIHAVFVVDGAQRPSIKRGKRVKTTPLWLTEGLRSLVHAFGFSWLEVCCLLAIVSML